MVLYGFIEQPRNLRELKRYPILTCKKYLQVNKYHMATIRNFRIVPINTGSHTISILPVLNL